MSFAWDEYWGEAVWKELYLLVVQPRVGDSSQLRGGGEDLNEGSVVQAEEEVWHPKQEETAFFHSISCSSGLSTYRMVSGLSSVTESTTDIHGLPALGAATRLHLHAFAFFLAEPESHPCFAPVRG